MTPAKPKPDPLTNFTCRLPKTLIKALKILAAEEETTVQAIVADALNRRVGAK